ncbi:MAG: hypothetical protein O0X49_07100, partial [Methanocorpusculum sp.]|nr:hypothetical protein [Methanocorpusculum sp.]
AMVMVVPVSATDTLLFSIPGKTTVVFPNDGISTMSTTDYGPLNIPQGLLASSSSDKMVSLSDDASEPRYALVTFNDPIPIRSNVVTLPIILYETAYNVTLEKMNFDVVDDGIDSYRGTISGLDDSTVIVTVGDGNSLHVSIKLPDESISVYPIQNRQYASQTSNPLHIVYSSNNLIYPDGNVVALCGTESIDSVSNTVESLISSKSIAERGEYDWAYVTVRVVTDSQFYSDSGNWQNDAAHYFANANEQFQRDDIKVILIPKYDHSRMYDLNSHPSRPEHPLEALKAYYSSEVLHSLGDDFCVYLGGYGITGSNSNYIGVAQGRYCWVRMPGIPLNFYDGSEFSRSYTLIHEIGHIFDAVHERAYDWEYFQFLYKFTVMKSSYQGEPLGQLHEFSSPAYHGTVWYDNAKVIRAAKHKVSAYT